MAERMFIEAIRQALVEEMERLPTMVVLGEDVQSGGVFRVTDGLAERFGPARVLDTPLAESTIVGAAIGLATNGCVPVAEIQFADFAFPAFNQLISEAARWRYRSNGSWGCPIVVRLPFGAGVRGALYHSQSIEAFYAHVPGLKVICVASPYDAKGLLKSAIRDPNPVMFLEHKKAYRLFREEVPDEDYTIPIGVAETKREGNDMTLVTYGLMTRYSLEAAEVVQGDDGTSVEVIDLRTVSPWDKERVLESVRKTGKALIVYEDNLTGGFGAEVAATIAQDAFDFLDGPVTRIASPDVPLAPYSGVLEEHILPNPEKIADGIRKLAAF